MTQDKLKKMNETSLYLVAYISEAINPSTELAESIANAAAKNNKKLQVSGFLYFIGSTFIQILEGKKNDLLPILGKIERDTRHRNIRYIQVTEIQHEHFKDWHMHFIDGKKFTAKDVNPVLAWNTITIDNPLTDSRIEEMVRPFREASDKRILPTSERKR